MNIKTIVLFALLLSLSFATTRWQYSDASGQVCFQVNSSVASIGKDANPWYNIITGNISLNSTFWNDTLRAFHTIDAQNIYMFYYANTSTQAYFMLPVIDSLSANQQDTYCLYSGSSDYNNPQQMAPYGLGFDTQTQFNNLETNNGSSYTAAWSNGYVLVTSAGSGGVSFYESSGASSYNDIFMIGKVKPVTVSGANSIAGIQAGDTSSLTTNGWGIGARDTNMAHGWYVTNENIIATNTNWNIFRIDAPRGAGTKYATIYDEDRAQIGSDTSTFSSTAFGNIQFTNLIYLRNASAYYDWAVAGRYMSNSDWNILNVSYDFVNTNISILSPTWEGIYDQNDGVLLRIQYAGGFDTCALSLNGINFKNYTALANNQITNDVLDESNMVVGENAILVSCYIGLTESHRYWYFTKTGANAEDLFTNAFNISITSLCNATVVNALSSCFEYYKLSTYYNFSAVACYNLNSSLSYSCLSINNRTKNGYTIFYYPSNWSYDSNESLEHIGAIFYYSGSPIDGRIELYDDNKFMYIPAQNKSRDCEIWFSSQTTGCSYWNGFVVNNRLVLVSDENNNWFIAGSNGIVGYNITYSQLVIPTSTLQVTDSNTSNLFTTGIFTRANCYVANDTFIINMVNTARQLYTVTVVGTNPFSYTLSSAQLYDNISIANVSSITVTSGNSTKCTYGSNSLLFLNFSLADISIDGAEILIWVLLLFATVLSAIIPFAMFVVIIINDIYQLLNVTQIALISIFAMLAGLVNNVTSLDRGVKHMIIIVAILVSYLSALSEYEGQLGVTFSGYVSLITQFRDLAASTDLWDFTLNLAGFVINLFTLIITLPAQFINLIYDLLYVISHPLFTAAAPFKDILSAGFMIYTYLKAYEVISNRFRTV